MNMDQLPFCCCVKTTLNRVEIGLSFEGFRFLKGEHWENIRNS